MFSSTQTQHIAGTAKEQSLGNNLIPLKGPTAVQVEQFWQSISPYAVSTSADLMVFTTNVGDCFAECTSCLQVKAHQASSEGASSQAAFDCLTFCNTM